MKPLIVVTGANGQLGSELQELSHSVPEYEFLFVAKTDLPINDATAVENFFSSHSPNFLINCAAYTAVDKAETDRQTAFAVNGEGVKLLAENSKAAGCKFIHISTDYVFDGNSPVPYQEDHETNAVNAYGESKLQGEKLCMDVNPDSVIIRTAWVYSQFGNNFVKTMLRLMSSRPEVNVVADQIGAPTYAADLAYSILSIIRFGKWVPGIFHYSNKGRISWYDFAVAIKEAVGSDCKVNAIPTIEFPTPAKRPAFSLLDTSKISSVYSLTIPDWQDSLDVCLKKIV